MALAVLVCPLAGLGFSCWRRSTKRCKQEAGRALLLLLLLFILILSDARAFDVDEVDAANLVALVLFLFLLAAPIIAVGARRV